MQLSINPFFVEESKEKIERRLNLKKILELQIGKKNETSKTFDVLVKLLKDCFISR